MNKKYIGFILFVVALATFFLVQKEPKKEVVKKPQKKEEIVEKSKVVAETLAKKDLKSLNLKEYKEVNGRTLIGSDLSAPQEISKDKEFINEASKDWKDKFLGLMNEDKSFDRKIKFEVLGSHIISHEKYLLNAESVKVSFTQRDGSLAHFKRLCEFK